MFRFLFLAIAATMLTAGTVMGATSPMPPNALSCDGWTKNADGSWHAGADTKPFDVDGVKQMTFRDSDVGPHSMSLGGVDLYDLLQAKCGSI